MKLFLVNLLWNTKLGEIIGDFGVAMRRRQVEKIFTDLYGDVEAKSMLD